jgi:quaternary ammonium compound-resistance protein SugE
MTRELYRAGESGVELARPDRVGLHGRLAGASTIGICVISRSASGTIAGVTGPLPKASLRAHIVRLRYLQWRTKAEEPEWEVGLMEWLLVVVAGLFETAFAVFLKLSHGLTNLWPTIGFAVCALISFGLLTTALRHLEVGPAYAVWTGIGATGTAVVGMAFLGESVSTLKIVSIGLVLAGVVGLNLSGVTP